ncbi:MAG: glycosyltransferase [Bacteroidales bacterium]|nr:glycosyltransferase [Bacteroidales bacterium]
MPYFSVITCTYNSEKYLPEAVASIETQTFRDYEHIIIDGFSTDQTMQIVEEYARRDARVKVFQYPAKGISNAMNMGLNHATGEVIHFLHSDEYYIDETSLRRAYKAFQKHTDYKWIMGKIALAFDQQIIIYQPFLRKLFYNRFIKYGNFVPHYNVFMKKTLFDQYGMFDEKFAIAMDYDYWLRIVSEKPLMIPDVFSVFKMHNKSVSVNCSTNAHKLCSKKVSLKYFPKTKYLHPIVRIFSKCIIMPLEWFLQFLFNKDFSIKHFVRLLAFSLKQRFKS